MQYTCNKCIIYIDKKNFETEGIYWSFLSESTLKMQIKCWFVPDIKTKHKVKYKFYELFVILFLNFCCLKYEINL